MDQFEKLFGTPHGVDFAHMAAAAGWDYQRVASADELPGALKGGGTRLLEVRTDRAASAAFQQQLRREISKAALAALNA
jgi:2-succinyl-5-enolpyruvyl-6-hydroxy-3-cyclohexene-1-carboxylate synthase